MAESPQRVPAITPSTTTQSPDRKRGPSSWEAILARPDSERRREYRYRFAQAVVFGLPVFALHVWGPQLGGAEALRWVGILQALLAGWVLYVGAGGMLFEGSMLLILRRRITADFVAGAIAAVVYLFGLIALVRVVAGAATSRPMFHTTVLVIALWTAARWAWLSRRGNRAA